VAEPRRDPQLSEALKAMSSETAIVICQIWHDPAGAD
jgi:hypothetical protein